MMLDALWTDVRLAARALREAPGFALIVVITFALAIGANTTVLSLVNALVLRPVDAPQPDRLLSISPTDARTGEPGRVYLDTFTAFRTQQQSFSRLSMYSAGFLYRVEVRGSAVDAACAGVLPEYFGLLGAKTVAGRLLTDADQPTSGAGAPVVVITDRLWRRLFGADGKAVGETLKVNGEPLTIVGITSPGFVGLQVDSGEDLYVPLATLRSVGGNPRVPLRAANLIGRLAPGVTLQQARAEVVARWPAIQAATIPSSLPEAEQRDLRSQRVQVESLEAGFSMLRRQYGTMAKILLGLTAILLAIGCVNLSGLILARALRRHQQITVRLALGASRARLIQQVLAEGLILALVGFAAAVPLAWWSSLTLTGMLSFARARPLLRPMTPDGGVFLMAAGITVAAGLLVSLLPAWRAWTATAGDALRPGRSIAGAPGRSWRLLQVGQVALSMVLLAGAGLFVATLSHLRDNEPYRGRQILWTRLGRNPGDRVALGRPYWQELIRKVSAIPGVDAASLSRYFPGYLGYPGALPTDTYVSASDPSMATPALTELASPGLFEMFGMARLRGRDFTWNDDENAPPVAIVNQSLASKLFPTGEVVGRRVRFDSGNVRSDLEVVGVVVDAAVGTIREPHQAVVFRPLLQDLGRGQFPMAHVRVHGDLSAVHEEYVRVVQAQGHRYVPALFTLDEGLNFAVLQELLVADVSVCAAALAVLLGCLGLYGLQAYTVATRVREIGVRIALGATRGAVVRMITRQGLALVLTGVLIGVPCAIAAAHLVRSQLYGIAPDNPWTTVGAAGIFLITGFVAAWLPAARASKLDPMDALRQE